MDFSLEEFVIMHNDARCQLVSHMRTAIYVRASLTKMRYV